MHCVNCSVVESVGDQVTNLKEGDIVIPTYIGECQECENCVSGKTNLCLTYPIRLTGLMPDNTSRMSIRGQRLHHVLSCATWSEYMVSDANYTLKVDPSIDPAHASFISCGFSTGFGAAWKEAKVESGSSVAVFGLGAVGLGAINGAKMLGATKIIGIDKNEMKRGKGEAFGMTDFINPVDSAKSVSELVKELSGGRGVDYSFECTGVAPLLTESLEATKVVNFTSWSTFVCFLGQIILDLSDLYDIFPSVYTYYCFPLISPILIILCSAFLIIASIHVGNGQNNSNWCRNRTYCLVWSSFHYVW
ncbi:Alcohol dehydrogenase class-3 chain H [Spatholobus suberectus]|nr:Alcohol dehydrogenase class-3 chain H [Spatholobus suberectus]